MKTAVIGHVEWAEFVQVDHVPRQGDIVHATGAFVLPAGGAAGAAMQLARLNGECLFITAVGNDERADLAVSGLSERGLRVEAVRRDTPQRRAFVYLDSENERTITTIGERVFPAITDELPWDELEDFDAVYLTAGNAETLRAARSARNVVATVRSGAALTEAGVRVDVLVASADDEGERYSRGDIEPEPRWVVRTEGAGGGTFEGDDGESGRWDASPLTGPKGDTYGAGDSFAGGLTYGLGRGFPIEKAIGVGAFCGASALRGRGPFEGQATASEFRDWEANRRVGR